MISREIISRCIEFRDPPRIGLHFQTDPIQGRVWDETDFACVGYAMDPQHLPQPGATRWVTEWGDVRQTINTGLGEAVAFPLGEGWAQLESYKFPDFTAPWRYAALDGEVARGHAAGKYVYGYVPGLMLQLIDLRGMENWFLDHVEAPEQLAYVLDRIVALREGMIAHYAAAGVDGVITWDDMGTNEQPFVSPAQFRELYFPRYKRTTDLLHEHGMHFIHHCCGQVRPYMDMFIEGGCDVLQLDQPTLMGIEWLGKNYGGKICFWNSTDIQKTMTAGSLDAIEAEARQQIWQLGNYGGGFMVKAYQQPESIGVTAAQAQRQYEAFKRHGNYPLAHPQLAKER
jgi:uroporphyrinogen decarboxylase